MTIPTIQIDLWLLGWAQTHNTGSKITFQISEEDLEHFKTATVKKGNRAGQRYTAVLVEVGDDELPVGSAASATPEKATPAKPAGYPPGLCGLAVQWCADPRFHAWLRETHGGMWAACECSNPERTARMVILDICGIQSRKELDTNPEAAARFEELIRQPFRKVLAEE